MGNSLRCCLACVLPCGALDLIRIVHINGEVEEYGRPISAKEVLDANPNHVISKPYSQGVTHRILIISPESDLKRGSIYFLIPTSAIPDKKKRRKSKKVDCSGGTTTATTMNNAMEMNVESEVAEKKRHGRRKSVKIAEWKPNLDSIFED